MYLKSIEVHGFKSFANKIKFEFHNGITGIVGPNGSGKSNVADAVRWVLGEQSAKQLRGSSMQDVIFSGTELRKPMGYAYVAITLDNSDHKLPVDYEEVTVTRRVYRSGESEYLLNGASCRLKDVSELFYDTGIGKEGYSIIGQGQIDKILSGKPEERRELFDEAAGIVKFKKRKNLSLKKLESEQANLVRVSDLLSELERQVGPLEKQSEVAKEYLGKKEKLKNLDINLFLLDAERITGELEEFDKKILIANDELNKDKIQFEDNKKEFEKLSTDIKNLEQEIEKKREELSQSGLLKEKLESEIKLAKEKINSSLGNIELYKNQKKSSTDRLELQKVDQSKFIKTKEDIDKKLEELTRENEGKKSALFEVQKRIEGLNQSIRKDNEEVINLVRERADVQADISRFDTMLEQTRLKKADIQSKLITAKSEEKIYDTSINEYNDKLQEILSDINKTEEEIHNKEKSLAAYKSNLESKDSELQKAQLDYHRRKSKLDSLKNFAERYEGYGGSIKRIMEKKDAGEGKIIGVVADVIKVDKEYETAIETALGGNIQNIITEDDDTAKRMIRFLKDNRGGRATFMPLTSVKRRGEYKKKEVRLEKGFLGIATELVKADKKYDDVISQLLGEIVVVDKYDNARNIERKYDNLLRIVTLEGEYFTPGGAVAGGSFRDNSNLLGRKREIDELSESTKKAAARIEEITKEIEDTKTERKTVREEIENLKEKHQEYSLNLNTVQMSIDSTLKKKEESTEGYSRLNSLSKSIESELQDIETDKKNTEEKIVNSKEREVFLNEEITGFGKELEKLRDEESEHVLNSTDMDMKLSALKRDAEHADYDVERVKGEISRLSEEIDAIEESIRNEEESITNRRKDIEELEKTIAVSAESNDGSEEKIREAVERKDELSKRQKELFSLSEEMQDKISFLDKEVYRLNSQKERLEEEQSKQIDYMWSEYEITLSRASEYRDEELKDAGSIKKGIYELRSQIRELGTVNVNAIEQYREVSERYNFYKTQHDDLIEAADALKKIIEDLDNAMRNQFALKFKEIADEFDKVFKEMFGGGKGTLELSEEEDILDAGIKIIAQPPGKKLQNMMQLSGGEKALAAIALLFAIQNLKPSPFCLLDEIEAALDESNVGRFAGYLNKLTDHTQFIVITHRRGTMEKADRLYGITMQEKGVSALVSVSLIDKDLDD
ncbi:MAG: chromosome segregation protein SMC [Lachnospiraceae bacterium]|nr:chromosome segregation protein SMC [Lachnospiraceae bacterium]